MVWSAISVHFVLNKGAAGGFEDMDHTGARRTPGVAESVCNQEHRDPIYANERFPTAPGARASAWTFVRSDLRSFCSGWDLDCFRCGRSRNSDLAVTFRKTVAYSDWPPRAD